MIIDEHPIIISISRGMRWADGVPTIGLSVILLLFMASNVGGWFACGSEGWMIDTPSEAYAWSYRPPQGCTCKATDISLTACNVFDCGCLCDLTAGKCDVNCCCDIECTEADLERFAELDSCLDEGPADEVVSHCYSTDSLDVINPKYLLSGGGAAQEALDGLLCVQYDNSDSKGEFYEDPGTLATSIFSDDAGTSEFSYHDLLTARAGTGAAEGDAYFDKGDRMPAAFLSDGGGTVAAFGGYLPLPVADDAGQCNGLDFAGFEVSVPGISGSSNENACATEVENLAEECAETLGWGMFSEDLYVGTTGTVSPSEIFNGDEYVQVGIASVAWRDWNTGQEFNFSYVNCAPFYHDPVGATSAELVVYSECFIGGGGGGETLGTSNGTVAEGCKNALASVCYTVRHDGEGSITGVSAALVLTDVPPGPGGGNSSVIVPRQFSVEFRPDDEAAEAITKSQDLGNIVGRVRSGNPGYLAGLPLLAGASESSGENEYIASVGKSDGGLELMAGRGRGCDDVGTFIVEFGYDGVGCCVLTLTRDDLQNHCEGTGPHVNPSDGFTPVAFSNTSTAVTHVGGYGNADPLDVTQWVDLPFASSANTASWDNGKGVCSSVVSALEYRILYTSVGAKGNPQSKVVSAEARYGKTEWTWREEVADEQNFLVCNSVSFKEYNLEAERYTPPSPPVAFTVPWDVFYPFFVSPTSGTICAVSPPLSPLLFSVFVTASVLLLSL